MRLRRGAAAGGVLLLLLLAGAAAAANISGFVRDAGSGESLPYANVYLQGEDYGTSSNERGYYALTGIPAGRHTLAASLIGYRPFAREVTLPDGNLVVEVRLQEQAIEMEATVVQAQREEAESYQISPSRTTLQVKELKAAPAAIEADPIRTIQTLPGVATLSDFSVGLYVRGGTPDQNLVLLDGTDVYNASHLFGLFSTFPADAAKSTELLRGGYPAKYGGRLSCVLSVITDEGNKEEFEAEGGVSLLASRLTVQGPALRGSYLLSGRRTHLDPILAIAEDKLDAKRFRYNFYDLQGKTHQVLSHGDQLTVAAYKGRDGLLYRFDEFDFDLSWGNRTLSTTWTHVFDSALFGSFMFTGSRFHSTTLFATEDVRLEESNRLTDLSFKADLNYYPSTSHSLEAGILAKRLSMEYVFGEEDQQWVDLDVEGYHHAGYLQDTWRATHLLTVQPGLRLNYFANGDYTGWSPRLSVRYQLGENTFLKAALGRYHQYVFRFSREFQEIALLSSVWALADTTAEPSHATHYIAGLETRIGGLDVEVEPYYKDYSGLYELNYDEQESMEIGDLLRRGDGRAYGLDLLVRKRAGHHTGWLSLSVGASERTVDGLNLDDRGREQSFNSKFDRTVSANLVHSWRFARRWLLNSRLAYATGQPYTQILGRGEVELPSGYRWTFDDRGELNGVRLPSYQRVDVSVQRQFSLPGCDMRVHLDVVNLLNRENVYNYFWDLEGTPEKRKPAKRRQIPMLPILPSFGVDFEF
ncbi:MAG: TonB-dependent receptor [Candidatus Latescibacterota bacterium]